MYKRKTSFKRLPVPGYLRRLPTMLRYPDTLSPLEQGLTIAAWLRTNNTEELRGKCNHSRVATVACVYGTWSNSLQGW